MQTPADPNLNPSLMLTERIRGLAGRVLGRHIPLVAFVSMLILLSPEAAQVFAASDQAQLSALDVSAELFFK